ncbi:GH11792 [Drosophila grimshawi]|uniref:GH11792 n=1 Tax=Drosophila grimshawi TaxID=7222 RepID=B4K0D1_DROGR|nr:GH11792 [Drosophila grimshawi]
MQSTPGARSARGARREALSPASHLRIRHSDELELLASPLHFPSVDGDSPSERGEGEGASPPHAPSIGEDAVVDAVPEADEEALPRHRCYLSDMDDVNPEWLRWQYPELPLTPEADTTEAWCAGPRPRIDSWPSTVLIETDETEDSEGETEGPGTLDEEEPMLISSEDDEDTGEERRSSASPVNPDDEETMPWPPETPEPEIIVISDEEKEEEQRDDAVEAQGQGERPQIPSPTVTATYARAFADGDWRHQRQSSAPEGEAGWQELPPPAWPPGITAMADAQPGPSRRASRIVWQEGHRYRVKTSMRGTRVFRKV